MTTRDAIIDAVFAEGLDRFTVTGVAKRLGITHGTLYRYYRSREELAAAAVSVIVERTNWPEPTANWRDTLSAFAQQLWYLCETSLGFAGCALNLAETPASIQRVITVYAQALRAHGLSAADAYVAIDLLGEEVLLTSMLLNRKDGAQVVVPALPKVDSDASTTWHWARDAGWLEQKIRLIVDGVEHRIGNDLNR
ncbi:MAG: TetR/AcrR family transcriptional regulator [Microbacterium sp.]